MNGNGDSRCVDDNLGIATVRRYTQRSELGLNQLFHGGGNRLGQKAFPKRDAAPALAAGKSQGAAIEESAYITGVRLEHGGKDRSLPARGMPRIGQHQGPTPGRQQIRIGLFVQFHRVLIGTGSLRIVSKGAFRFPKRDPGLSIVRAFAQIRFQCDHLALGIMYHGGPIALNRRSPIP